MSDWMRIMLEVSYIKSRTHSSFFAGFNANGLLVHVNLDDIV